MPDPTITPPLTGPAVAADLVAIGRLIKQARKEALGESREAFAQRMGCSPLTLDKIEAGAAGVGFGHVMAALRLISANEAVVTALERSVDMLQLAQHPVRFPTRG
jgi:transcriptional regulator with XRE-family HTH domain